MGHFIGREPEQKLLTKQLRQKSKTAVLVYGKRRIGKSVLIAECAKAFDGIVINHLCVQSTYAGNLSLLYRNVSDAIGIPPVSFAHIYDLFSFLGKQKRKILLVLDEYQYLKASLKKTKVDSYLQNVIDTLPENVKLILCGSYISIMKELLQEDNPLFGRFSAILHVEEFDYYDAARFFPDADIQKKIALYAVFGGSPYVLSNINARASTGENIRRLLLPQTGVLRTYIENIVLREIQKAYDVRIFEIIGNGKRKYSEIADALGGTETGLLDKQLKYLIQMETIEKVFPMNRHGDKKKQFYTVRDNLLRFYFTFIFGNEGRITRLGEKTYYNNYIETQIRTFISLRFEEVACQYFSRCAKNGKRKDIADIGSYWYDNPETRMNGQFDCVIQTDKGYDFYECKFHAKPMTKRECEQEEAQIKQIPGVHVRKCGFVCPAGFSFSSRQYDLISGAQLYAP